jgi:hypothetical protein
MTQAFPSEAQPPVELALPPWSAARRIRFRFLFSFLVLELFPFPLGRLPYTEKTEELYDGLWQSIAPWVAVHLLRLQPLGRMAPGSDSTYDFVRYFCFAAAAALATAIWSALDRRPHYVRLEAALRVYLRYWLAATMISYGVAKLLPTQFPPPPATVLLGRLGDASPMRLLWTFMGLSRAYCVFAGAAECLGGALLFFRRTTLLGATILLGVLGNVVLLNFCFDVPVKAYSTLLLLGAAYLVWPDARRLADFFLLNRPVEPAEPGTARLSPRGRRIWLGSKAAIIALLVGTMLWQGWSFYRTRTPPLAGFYGVEQFTGARPWETAELTWYGFFVRRKDGSRAQFQLGPHDAMKKTLALRGSYVDGTNGKSWVLTEEPFDGGLILEGSLDDGPFSARLRRSARPEFLLEARGFHWVSEHSYNR